MADVAWRMKGQYIKNCNCIATCPCDTIGFPYPEKGCEGMAGMHIVEGNFGDVKLNGLNWAVTYSWPGALHEGNGSVQPFIDEKATEAQRTALLTVLSGQAGNAWFEVLASIVTTVHDPQFVPITWEFDKARRKARVRVPGFLETQSAPLKIPATDDEQQVIVRMPAGMEYKEFQVAQSVVLKGTGAIQFDYRNTHSSLADVEHTHQGLQA
ncbi:MAG: hypothetical protein DMG13_17445 [Acidobacteria bacterium]|nr:MAG: hypothetical protein DMG13_17445 [Acidobacteriota bacterium]